MKKNKMINQNKKSKVTSKKKTINTKPDNKKLQNSKQVDLPVRPYWE